MKKKIVSSILLILIAFAAGWNIYQSQTETTLNEIALGNVEALANKIPTVSCPRGEAECIRVFVGNTVHIYSKPKEAEPV